MHIVVVGGGILGASAAFHLARAGAQVTIVDQAHEGRATAAGAGIICPWVSGADDAAFYRLYVEGARYYGELVPVLAECGETDLGFRRVGALVVSDDADELAAFHAMLCRRRADTPEMGDTSVLSPRDARALFPPLRTDLAGLHVANGARVDGRRMAAGLLRAALGLGARQVEGRAELLADGNRVTGVADPRCNDRAPMASSSPPARGRLRCCRLWASRCRSSRSAARSCICDCRSRIRATGRSCCRRAATTCWHSMTRASSSGRRGRAARVSIIASPRPARPRCWRRRCTWRRVSRRRA